MWENKAQIQQTEKHEGTFVFLRFVRGCLERSEDLGRDGEREQRAERALEMWTSGENSRSTLPPEFKRPFGVNRA